MVHLVFLFPPGIDANIKDSLGRTVLDILKEHPSQKSLQIATLLQGKQCQVADDFALQPRLSGSCHKFYSGL